MIRLIVALVVLFALGCSGAEMPPHATDCDTEATGGGSPVEATGGSLGGSQSTGGASLGGVPPALTLANLDVPAVVELVDGEFCWGFSEECEPVPTFDPPLVEWNPDRDDQVIVRIPPGACALRIEVNDEGLCWIGPRRITRGAEQVEPYEGHLTRVKDACSETWRLEIHEGGCIAGMGGGGS